MESFVWECQFLLVVIFNLISLEQKLMSYILDMNLKWQPENCQKYGKFSFEIISFKFLLLFFFDLLNLKHRIVLDTKVLWIWEFKCLLNKILESQFIVVCLLGVRERLVKAELN